MKTKILLSGVPGGGKTYLGGLMEAHGYRHIDMEADRFAGAVACLSNPTQYIDRLPDQPLILTWGFNSFSIDAVLLALLEHDFTLVWCDGNRAFFYDTYMRRENDSEAAELAFYIQMSVVVSTRIKHRFPWLPFNPFDEDGRFHPDVDERLWRLINE